MGPGAGPSPRPEKQPHLLLSGSQVSFPHPLAPEPVPQGLALSGMIYGEQRVLWEGRSGKKALALALAAASDRSEPLPLLLIHTFLAGSTLEGPFLFT